MFTLCMSRGHPPLHNSLERNNPSKQVKGGYLLRYRSKRGFFCKEWSEEWVVLYEDSTIAWFSDKCLSRPRGRIKISEAPELLAVGEWTRQVPRKPRFPRSCHVGQLLAIGTRIPHAVHWLMAQSSAEVNDWMTAISNTLPPPPHLPLENKHCTPTNRLRDISFNDGSVVTNRMCTCPNDKSAATITMNKVSDRATEADHTILSGVVIDWGHGWGWGQSAAWATQAACTHDTVVSSSLYYHAADDYTFGGCEEVDWSAFGDFCF